MSAWLFFLFYFMFDFHNQEGSAARTILYYFQNKEIIHTLRPPGLLTHVNLCNCPSSQLLIKAHRTNCHILRGFQQASALQLLHHLLGLILVKGLPGVDVKVDA